MLPERHTGPGLVDLQVNGYAGFDFNGDPSIWSAESWKTVAEAIAARGVVMSLPTFITDAPDRLVKRAARYGELMDRHAELEKAFPGLHIEGPFISSEDGPRGAHPREFCATPDDLPDLLGMLLEASGGRIRILTLAPELPGAIRLIEKAAERGICVAVGHTAADANTLNSAVEAGVRMSTHLGNGSHQLLPRLDNYLQRQLADDRLAASFIADGHHIPFPVLKNFLRAKGLERSVLVTDAIPAADKGPGTYRLGGLRIEVSEDLRCAQPGASNLAGSALTLDRAVINVTRFCGIPFDEVWTMASIRPAELAGLPSPGHLTVRIEDDRMICEQAQG